MFHVDGGQDGGEAQQHMSLVVPFVACLSQGGPYEDKAFAAGFQAGEIHRALCIAAPARAVQVRFPMVRSDLLPQLDLLAMHAGFVIVAKTIDAHFPEWADVTFAHAASDLPSDPAHGGGEDGAMPPGGLS